MAAPMDIYALIPAKKDSFTFPHKNWLNFSKNLNLVDYTIKNIPDNFFNKVIVSTNNVEYKPRFPNKCQIHQRTDDLSQWTSDINELIRLIIKSYSLINQGYLWLLNPTSPFRHELDFINIKKIINDKKPKSIISVSEISPYIWKDTKPQFKIIKKRKNTQNLPKFTVENGLFYVFEIGSYLKHKTWYNNKVFLYEINSMEGLIDIDTEKDFKDGQIIGNKFKF